MFILYWRLEKILFLVFPSSLGVNKCMNPISLLYLRVLSLWEMFYACGDMFKLNIITSSSRNVVNGSTYMLVHSNFSLWHKCLRHVSYKRLKETSRLMLELITNFDENIEKYKTCMLTKIIRSSFPNV